MLVGEGVIGRLDGAFADREAVETVILSDAERKRSRVRTTTDAGTDIGLVLGDATLQPGDVVYADEERVVAVAFEDREALVVDLSGVSGGAEALAALIELGHAVGNRHRDLATRGSEVLFPIEGTGDRIEDEVTHRLPEGATTRREPVDPTLFDEDEDAHGGHGRDDGGHGGEDHGHQHPGHGDDHDHPHAGDGHSHPHGGEEAGHRHDGHHHGQGRVDGRNPPEDT
jgi:urease accessory protein